MGTRAFTVTSLVFSLLLGALAEQCGKQANGALCPNGLCCSAFGWCGTTDAYCCDGCQSQCNCGGGGGGGGGGGDDDDDCGGDSGGSDDDDGDGNLDSIIPKSTFEEMLLRRNDPACPASGFYTYEAFIKAAKAFPDFATQGDDEDRKREIAAFFGQTSHETTGGWPDAPDGPYAWGYCFNEEIGCPPFYCDATNLEYPCAPGKTYCGRGPMQLSWNYNYGQCGEALGFDLLNKPECVKKDPVLAFKTALWFWMTPQAPKPSCHDVITGKWVPSNGDLSAGRVPGYGAITNIINGGLECGIGPDTRVNDRIGFYKRYCDIFGIDYGDNLDCSNQRPFGSGLFVNTI